MKKKATTSKKKKKVEKPQKLARSTNGKVTNSVTQRAPIRARVSSTKPSHTPSAASAAAFTPSSANSYASDPFSASAPLPPSSKVRTPVSQPTHTPTSVNSTHRSIPIQSTPNHTQPSPGRASQSHSSTTYTLSHMPNRGQPTTIKDLETPSPSRAAIESQFDELLLTQHELSRVVHEAEEWSVRHRNTSYMY